MKNIQILDKVYTLKTQLSEMTLKEMCSYLKIIMRGEKEEIKMVDGSTDYEYIERGRESYNFLLQRDVDIICLLSDMEPEYARVLATDLMPLIQIDTKSTTEVKDDEPMRLYTMKGVYECRPINEWCFQQWCDYENLVSDDYMMFYALLFNAPGKPYNRFHPEMVSKYQLFGELPAEENIDLLYSIMNTSSILRRTYQFVYGEGVGEGAGREVREHHKRFKWNETVCSLANNPAPIFNHPNGTLYGVRNANVLDVLDYLNIKRSKDDAEYLDWKAKNKSSK